MAQEWTVLASGPVEEQEKTKEQQIIFKGFLVQIF